MSASPELSINHKMLSGRMSAVRWRIRNVEFQYADLDFDTRRNIHLQGSKARFLLAGIVQHRPSQNNFQAMPIETYDTEARGPREMCPIIDIYEDVRVAQKYLDEWNEHSTAHSFDDIHHHVCKAERVAREVQVLFDAVERGGDQTPPLVAATETLSDFCQRILAHNDRVSTSPDGYDGCWFQVPTNDTPLASQQVINNWNAVCGHVRDGMPLEAALSKVRMATRNMEPQELAWVDQKREWFVYEPRLEA